MFAPCIRFFSGVCLCYCGEGGSFLLSLGVVFVILLFLCSRWSFVDVPMSFSCPADYVPDRQLGILLGMVKARSVKVKNTHTYISNPQVGYMQ